MRKFTSSAPYSIKVVVGYILLLVFWMVIRHPIFYILTSLHHQNLFIWARVADVVFTSLFFLWISRRVERDLRKTQREYQTLVDLSPDPIVIHQDGFILDANKYTVSLLGYRSREEVVGRRMEDFIDESDRQRVNEGMNETKNGAIPPLIEFTLLARDGQKKAAEGTSMPIMFNGQVAVRSILRDVTRRKSAEQQLSRVANVFRRFEETATDLVAMLDASGQVHYLSPSHDRLVMADPESNSVFGVQIHPDDFPAAQKLYLRMLQTMEPQRVELRLKLREKGWADFETYANPVMDKEGRYDGAVFVTRDITQRKMTEELMRRSDKLSAVGQLAAGLAHEVRNPITVVSGFLQLMKGSRTLEEEHIDLMISELERIEGILTEFLILSKPTDSNQPVAEVCICVQEIVTLLQTQAILKSIQIRMESESKVVRALCDASHLKQVLVNLVKNAIEAMDNRGSIVIYVDNLGDRVRIGIVDEGPGMPPELVARLGEAFVTTKANGTGLGLLVSRQLVEQSGGTFAIQSEVGVGTEVTITFRCPEEPQLGVEENAMEVEPSMMNTL